MFDPDRAGGIFTYFFLPIRSPSRLGASIYQIPLCEEEGVGQGKVPYNVQCGILYYQLQSILGIT